MLAWREMKCAERNGAITLSPAHVDNGIEGDKRNGEIGRMSRDTALTRPKNCVSSTYTCECGAARAWLAFVAGRSDVPKIRAPCALQDISADGSHVAHLARRGKKQRLTDDRITLAESCLPCDVTHPTKCSKAQTSAGQVSDRREYPIICAEYVDVDQQGRPFYVELHQVDECRSTSNEPCGATWSGLGAHGLVYR
jgi:hypothetical protein